jgi:hypothetical protein
MIERSENFLRSSLAVMVNNSLHKLIAYKTTKPADFHRPWNIFSSK